MDEDRTDAAPRRWIDRRDLALGTFHAAVIALVVAVVLAAGGHLLSTLRESPLIVVVVVAALWTISCWTTARALRALEGLPSSIGHTLDTGVKWGTIAAPLPPGVYLGAFLVFQSGAVLLRQESLLEFGGNILIDFRFGVLVGLPAAALGTAVGLTLALLDTALLRLARTVR